MNIPAALCCFMCICQANLILENKEDDRGMALLTCYTEPNQLFSFLLIGGFKTCMSVNGYVWVYMYKVCKLS